MYIFQIPIKPLSINASLASFNGRMIKTAKHRAYCAELNAYLCEHKDVFLQLKTEHLRRDCAVKVTYYVYMPKDEYYAKTGKVNKKRMDAANMEKNLTDCLMKAVGIDDVYCNPAPSVIVIPKDKWMVVISIELCNHPTHEDYSGI